MRTRTKKIIIKRNINGHRKELGKNSPSAIRAGIVLHAVLIFCDISPLVFPSQFLIAFYLGTILALPREFSGLFHSVSRRDPLVPASIS